MISNNDLLRLRCSGHVLSKMKLVTPHFFYISDITNSTSFNGKIFREKSMLENFCADILNRGKSNRKAIIDTVITGSLIGVDVQ